MEGNVLCTVEGEIIYRFHLLKGSSKCIGTVTVSTLPIKQFLTLGVDKTGKDLCVLFCDYVVML